jgi:hypothetical protein
MDQFRSGVLPILIGAILSVSQSHLVRGHSLVTCPAHESIAKLIGVALSVRAHMDKCIEYQGRFFELTRRDGRIDTQPKPNRRITFPDANVGLELFCVQFFFSS